MLVIGILPIIAAVVMFIIGLNTIAYVLIAAGVLIILFAGFKTVRPIERGVIERFGRYQRTKEAGLTWIIPMVDRMYKVNITEQMVDVLPQQVITKDKLNAEVDAVVYYLIKDVKASIYNVDDHRAQLTSLARTTLRAVIGNMTLTDANEKRSDINSRVETVLDKETNSYGVEVLRVEIQKIEPPTDVQDAMNKVVKAEQEKIAARDMATATETRADGDKRAEIKKAEGIKRGLVLSAEGEAAAIKAVADANATKIKVVNEAAQKYFVGNAQILKKIEAVEISLKDNAKIIVDTSKVQTIVTEAAGITPIPGKGSGAKKARAEK
jgi:regulator of protease activity HflC (stomatin/prohibitin superfamily)